MRQEQNPFSKVEIDWILNKYHEWTKEYNFIKSIPDWMNKEFCENFRMNKEDFWKEVKSKSKIENNLEIIEEILESNCQLFPAEDLTDNPVWIEY